VNDDIEIAKALREHLEVCQELMTMVMKENKAFKDSNAPSPLSLYQTKKQILPRLEQSAEQIRNCRLAWQARPPEERKKESEISQLLDQNQQLILKVIMLDRENEQILLRRGFGPPKEREPAVRQQPHFVAGLYRRSNSG
jgi:hypothetical protein